MRASWTSRRVVLGALFAVAALVGATVRVGVRPAAAAPAAGDLDLSFNGTGVAQTAIVSQASTADAVRAPDGTMLALADGSIWRFTEEGSVDPSFGGGDGIVPVSTDPSFSPDLLAVLPDGRFVVWGVAAGSVEAVARFLPDGSLDATFGDDGVALVPDADLFIPAALLVQATGHLVLVANTSGPEQTQLVASARITPDGDDVALSEFADPSADSDVVRALDAVVTADDRIVIATGNQNDDGVGVIRLQADLAPDPTFGGGDGYDAVADTDNAVATISNVFVAVQPDGTIGVLAGQLAPLEPVPGERNGLWLFRWDPSGASLGAPTATSFDPSIEHVVPAGLVVGPGGGLLAAGDTFTPPPGPETTRLAVVSYSPTGANVAQTVTAIPEADLRVTTVVPVASGRFMVFGDTDATIGRELMLARVDADTTMDADFGAGGFVTITAGTNELGEAVAVQPDGGVLVAGSYEGCEATLGFLVRFRSDGLLDAGFGGNASGCGGTSRSGVVLVDHEIHGVTVDGEGRILVAGGDHGVDTNADEGVVLRLLPDGSPDLGFSTDGRARVQSEFLNEPIALNGVAVDADGRVVAVGTEDGVDDSGAPFQRIVVARWLADGSEDVSFGAEGRMRFPDAPVADGRAVAVQPDGKVVVVGAMLASPSAGGPCCGRMVVARLDQDGSFDEGFGGPPAPGLPAGIRLEDNGATLDRGFGVALRPDGRMVVAGFAADVGPVGTAVVPGPPYLVTVQLTSDGARDPSFGAGGLFSTNGRRSGTARGVALDAAGNAVLAGGAGQDAVVGRLTPAGVPDPAFGPDGFVQTDLGAGEEAAGVALAPDGRIVVGGTVADDRGRRPMAARHHPVTIPDPQTPPPGQPPPDQPPTPTPRLFAPTITFNPAVGQAGTVTTATFSGYPPNASLELIWSNGIRIPNLTVAVGAAGTLDVHVLIFPSDAIGPRMMTATSTHPDTGAPLAGTGTFLVGAGTSQPGDFASRR